MTAERRVTLTFDLFSALIDSRTGAGAVFDRLGTARGWSEDGTSVYDAWDARNKRAQRDCSTWVPYHVLAREALADAYAALELEGDADADLAAVLGSLPEWPLWPDVAAGLPALGKHYRLGVLSNVDDDLFRQTQARGYVDADLVMSSQRLGVYKPNSLIYLRAQDALGPMVHVASSARDVRGASEAGIPVVRLRRSGHTLDPDGPRPAFEAADMAELETLVPLAVRR